MGSSPGRSARCFFPQSHATPSVVPWSVNGGKLQIHAKVWNDNFPIRELQLDQTRVLDLLQEPGWQPRGKSFGVNGFGFNAGRFKLQNGELVDLYLAKETTAVLTWPASQDEPSVRSGAGSSNSKSAAISVGIELGRVGL